MIEAIQGTIGTLMNSKLRQFKLFRRQIDPSATQAQIIQRTQNLREIKSAANTKLGSHHQVRHIAPVAQTEARTEEGLPCGIPFQGRTLIRDQRNRVDTLIGHTVVSRAGRSCRRAGCRVVAEGIVGSDSQNHLVTTDGSHRSQITTDGDIAVSIHQS